MKKTFFIISVFLATFFLYGYSAKSQTSNSTAGLLKHIVIITFKPDASADSIKTLDDIYTSLAKSPLVKDFDLGVDISTRNKGQLKHVYVTTFSSKEDMTGYSKIPEYQKLFKISLSIADDVSVVDYWKKK